MKIHGSLWFFINIAFDSTIFSVMKYKVNKWIKTKVGN